MPSLSAFGYTNGCEKNKTISFYRVPSKKWKEELCMKWIRSIKQTGNLPMYGGFFLCESHFDES